MLGVASSGSSVGSPDPSSQFVGPRKWRPRNPPGLAGLVAILS